LNFLIVNLIPPVHDIKWTVFLHVPTLLLSTYFQVRIEAQTYSDIYMLLPKDYIQINEISQPSTIVTSKLLKMLLVAFIIVGKQWIHRIDFITQVIDKHNIKKQKETLGGFFSCQKDALILFNEESASESKNNPFNES
jgi:hypothetical protein